VRDEGQDRIEEVVDGELVELPSAPAARPEPPRGLSSEGRPGQAVDWARSPAAQNAFAAATGFVAGAATLALARRYGRARLERALAAGPSEMPALTAAGAQRGPGRTYLVHVRQLGSPDA